MKTKKLLSFLLAVVMGFVMLTPGHVSAAAFGISPPWVKNNNLKPGSRYVYVIDLSTNDPAQDMLVHTTVQGAPEIMEWVNVRNEGNLVMPKGDKHFSMYVEVNIPENAKLGKYKGSIAVRVEPKDRVDKESVSILLGGNIEVELEVINYDVIDYWVKSVSVTSVLEGQPLSLSLTVKNLGNVNLTDVETRAKVLNYKSEEVVALGSASRLSIPIYPQTSKEVGLSVPLDRELSEGNYWVDVDVLKNGASTYKNRLYFTVSTAELSNNVLKTAVRVAKKGDLRAVAEPTVVSPDKSSQVKVKTTVTVRAPLTNQLIAVVIVLLIVLIVITTRIYQRLKRRR